MEQYARDQLADADRERKPRKAPPRTTGAAAPTPAPAPAPAKTEAPPPVARMGGGVRPGQALGGLVVGLFAWGFASAWLSGGQAEAYGWLRAKFLNEPYGAAPAPSSPSPAQTTNATAARQGRPDPGSVASRY